MLYSISFKGILTAPVDNTGFHLAGYAKSIFCLTIAHPALFILRSARTPAHGPHFGIAKTIAE